MALKRLRPGPNDQMIPGPSKKGCNYQSETMSIRRNPETIMFLLIDVSLGDPEVSIYTI